MTEMQAAQLIDALSALCTYAAAISLQLLFILFALLFGFHSLARSLTRR
jgi:hypothetical protein